MAHYPHLHAAWRAEEAIAQIHGWDFSHIDDRYTEENDLPWDYRTEILSRLTPEMRILDLDTGGGEFLRRLGHPPALTAATEGYPPNIALCERELLPLGIDFRPADAKGALPFGDGRFDLVLNRHGDLNPTEIARVLRPGGLFITQQVGAENDRALVELLLGDTPMPFPDQYLSVAADRFAAAGFSMEAAAEHFGRIRFFDVGALVWFARIIEWEFPDFSVDTHLDALEKAQTLIEQTGEVSAQTHRFLLIARKTPA
ncbi:MAG: methyltransferase domain-containing protein [Clostridia bacterium]|nr:methyltransferase domain-containing protein [Clostridia bacterium]